MSIFTYEVATNTRAWVMFGPAHPEPEIFFDYFMVHVFRFSL